MKRDPRRNAIGIGLFLCVEREKKKPRPLSRAMKKSDQILRFSSGNNVTHVISFVFFRLEIHTRTIEIQLFSSRFFSVYIVANFSGRNIRKFILKRSIRVSFDPFRSWRFVTACRDREKDDVPPSQPKTRKRRLGVTQPGNAESRARNLWDFTRS